jgi:hypothetical protein
LLTSTQRLLSFKTSCSFMRLSPCFTPLLVHQAGGLTEAELRRLIAYIPPLNKPNIITGLVSERAAYVAECLATPAAPWKDCDVEALWHESRFQRMAAWHAGGRIVMLAQPSSAPVERVFSMLQTVVSDQQGNGLSDMQAGAMMVYYNSRERART